MPMSPEEKSEFDLLKRIVYGMCEAHKEQYSADAALHEALAQYEGSRPADDDLVTLGVEPCARPDDPSDTERKARRSEHRSHRANIRALQAQRDAVKRDKQKGGKG